MRGIGEVGSAVAHALFVHGHPVVVHDLAAPLTTRRRMAFADAIYDGRATLAGVRARRAGTFAEIEALLAAARVLPVTALDFCALIARLSPGVLVDARMRKRAEPDDQRAFAVYAASCATASTSRPARGWSKSTRAWTHPSSRGWAGVRAASPAPYSH